MSARWSLAVAALGHSRVRPLPRPSTRLWWVLSVAALGAGAAGCGGNEDTSEPPAELQSFEEQIEVRRLWSARVGRNAERLRLGLSPATDGAWIYAGSHGGEVASFAVETGRRGWSAQTGLPLSAGPAYGSGILALGTTDGELIALDAENGEELWRRSVGAEVLSPPAIGGEVVALRTVDGRLRGYSTQDGRELWAVVQSVPALTMRGNTAPYVAGTSVIAGFDNGRLGAYELTSGDTLWELAVAAPSGRTELERLVDISAGLQVAGNDVFAVGYHGRAVGVALETGLVLWQQQISSYAGLGVDLSSVYVTDEFSELIALERGGGTPRWRQNALRLRDVTAPSAYGNTVVVGDFEGYLHWIDPTDGRFLARARGASNRIASAPLVVGRNLITQAEDGTVAAYTVVMEDPAPASGDDSE